MYTEEQILDVLQNALDYYNEEKAKNPRNEFSYDFASKQFQYYWFFAQDLTKKLIGINEGKVYFKGEIK